jgi:drug/metabolite transporter (DMT)-like permease
MDTHVFLAVLLAAALHAGWNATLKVRLEPLRAITLVSIASAVPAIATLTFVPLPASAAWPYIAASLIIHLVYYIALAEADRTGDLGQVYPIARGSAPLMTAVGALAVLGEGLKPAGFLGVALLALGVILLSLRGGRVGGRFETRAVAFALVTALSISTYSIIDGIGVRSTPVALSYIGWLFLFDGLMMLAFGAWRYGGTLWTDFRGNVGTVLIGGAMAAAAYAIALWAMAQAPIALVAALRETSVLFAALIGMIFLKEPLVPVRIAAALVVCAGVGLLRLA